MSNRFSLPPPPALGLSRAKRRTRSGSPDRAPRITLAWPLYSECRAPCIGIAAEFGGRIRVSGMFPSCWLFTHGNETRLATTRACNAYQKFERTPPLTWLSRPSSRPSSGQCLCLFCLSVRFPSQAKLSDCCVPSESCGEDKRECIAILILCMKRSI